MLLMCDLPCLKLEKNLNISENIVLLSIHCKGRLDDQLGLGQCKQIIITHLKLGEVNPAQLCQRPETLSLHSCIAQR